MDNHAFHMRLCARYADPDNAIDALDVDLRTDSGWEGLQLDAQTPGFLLFVYTIFACQHMYLRTNAAERGLALASSTGRIDVIADPDWVIRTLHVRFTVALRSGTPGPTDAAYIAGRMRQCPVSRNLAAIPDAVAEVQFGD